MARVPSRSILVTYTVKCELKGDLQCRMPIFAFYLGIIHVFRFEVMLLKSLVLLIFSPWYFFYLSRYGDLHPAIINPWLISNVALTGNALIKDLHY